MRAVHQCIGILVYQLVMGVVTGVGISCALVYCCASQILAYQLVMGVVAGMGTPAASAYQCA